MTALRGPLRQDKALKLFTIVDVAAPQHSLLSWPVRCHLLTQQDGLYISTVTGKLAANAEVPCCSEELIINLGGRVTPATSHGAAAVGRCSLWNSNATHLASLEPSTSQIIMQSQHACTGREDFKLHLYKYNEIVLTHQEKETHSAPTLATCTNNTCTNTDKVETVETGVVCRWPSVKCISGEKPTKLIVELASRPCFIINAHGQLMGSSSDAGTLAASSFSSNFFSGGETGVTNKQLNAQCWQFEHHGDSIYSIKNTAANKLLYVSEAGALKIDGNEPLFPDSRVLFNIELAWTKIESRGGFNSGESLAGSSRKVVHPEQRERPGGMTSSGQHLAGFTIRTVFRLDGKQLCLSALPDGRIGTCYRKSHPSRWELFAVADREAVLQSSAQPLLRLPAFQDEVPQQLSTMRRSSSCQAIMKTPAVAACSSILSTSPSTLPGILEQAAFEDRKKEGTSDEEDDDSSVIENHDVRGKLPREIPGMRGRRCASESTLSQLQGNSRTMTKEPTWLADLRKTQSQPSGWDVRSAATMQDQSCYTLCAAALSDSCCILDPQPPKTLNVMHPTDLIASAESLPDEIKHRVAKILTLLTTPPAAAKLSFEHLNKAAVHGNALEWSKDLIMEDVDVEMLPEEIAEVQN